MNAAGTHRAMQDAEHPKLSFKQIFMVWMLKMLPSAPALLGWSPGAQHCQDSQFTALHELNQVGEEHIPVALTEAVHVVGDLGMGGELSPMLGLWDVNGV